MRSFKRRSARLRSQGLQSTALQRKAAIGAGACLAVSAIAGINPFGGSNVAAAVPFSTSSTSSTTTSTVSPGTCATTQPSRTSVTSIPGGGTLYSYDDNGTTQNFPVPPSGFDPLTASASQLAEYDFPPRPPTSQPKTLAEWQTVMTDYRSTVKPDPIFTCTPLFSQPEHSPPSLLGTILNTALNSSPSGNWSGYEANGSANQYVAVQGDFTQPTDSTSKCASNAEESTWVGLGGEKSTAGLVQDGTALNENIAPPVPLAYSTYQPWYEILNGQPNSNFGPDYLGTFAISPGDSIHEYISYETSTNTVDFYIADNTNGTSGAFDWDISLAVLKFGAYYDGSTADWITEAPGGGPANGGPPLANYGSINWNTAQAELGSNGSWVSVGSQTNTSLNMMNGNTLLSKTSTLNSDSQSWTNTWKACQ